MGDVDSKITIKLLIDANSQKVLFGEAGKDFVYFMFTILTIPLSSFIRILYPPTIMIGSFSKCYQSVVNLKDSYFVTNRNRSSLLQLKTSPFDDTVEHKYYICGGVCKKNISTTRNITCPNCNNMMGTEVALLVPSVPSSSIRGGYEEKSVGGFVKGVTTYMITDDLEVTPMSAISTFILMNRFSKNNDVQFEEKVVVVGKEEKSAMAHEDSKITLKLLIDARSHKVLFGEAGKDFIDFMFSLLTLPLGAVINLLSPETMIGSIGKLYQSVENLKETYFVTNMNRSSLLQPKTPTFDVTNHLLLDINDTVQLKYYTCGGGYCKTYFTTTANFKCPSCNIMMNKELSLLVPSMHSTSVRGGYGEESVGGFVKGVITYMITDDLVVTPMSAISSITLMNRFSKNNDVRFEEKVVVVGMEEGLALLRASLNSPTALTDVFCSSTKKAKSYV